MIDELISDVITKRSDWNTTTVGEALKLRSGKFLNADSMDKSGSYAVYGGNGVNGCHSAFMFDERKIVIGRVGAYCGVVHRTAPKSWVTDNALIVDIIDSRLSEDFTEIVLRYAGLNQYSSQSGQPLISESRLENVRLPVPPAEIQNIIVSQITRSDRLRRTRRYAQTLSNKFLQSVFLEMFGDPVTNPKGWGILPLQDLIDTARPITYGILKPGPDIVGGIPYVRVVDIGDGRINVAGVRRTTPEIAKEYRRSTIKEGDLLMSIRGHVGRMAVVPALLNGANITQDTARLAPNNLTDAYFLFGTLMQQTMKRKMDNLTRGAAVQGINLGDVRELPIMVPPQELRWKYASAARTFGRLQYQQREATRQADHLFQSLLQRAFQTDK